MTDWIVAAIIIAIIAFDMSAQPVQQFASGPFTANPTKGDRCSITWEYDGDDMWLIVERGCDSKIKR